MGPSSRWCTTHRAPTSSRTARRSCYVDPTWTSRSASTCGRRPRPGAVSPSPTLTPRRGRDAPARSLGDRRCRRRFAVQPLEAGEPIAGGCGRSPSISGATRCRRPCGPSRRGSPGMTWSWRTRPRRSFGRSRRTSRCRPRCSTGGASSTASPTAEACRRCSAAPAAPARRWRPRSSPASWASSCCSSTSRRPCPSTWARRRRTSTPPSASPSGAGRCSCSTKPMRCSASGPRSRMPTIATPTWRSPTSCSAWRRSRASPSSRRT